VVVVTGAASGIGRALAHRFAKGGARLGLLDRDPTPLPALVSELAELGVESLPLSCDVTRWQDCQTAIQSVLEHFGGIDILVNNAGITHLSRFSDTDVSVVRKVMEVNFFGAVHCTKAALPALVERRGLVIVTSSIAGFSPLAGRCGYSAAKHALHGFFESLRCETQMSGLRVMMVCPGFTDTAIGRNALGGDGGPPRATRTTAGKAADPNQVANAIYQGALRGRRMLVLSPVGKLAFAVSRLFPSVYERMMTRSMLRDFD
jgi:NAD(P)-dependent dehydrogenase (short-subunit alcohol dehydrogenase family)